MQGFRSQESVFLYGKMFFEGARILIFSALHKNSLGNVLVNFSPPFWITTEMTLEISTYVRNDWFRVLPFDFTGPISTQILGHFTRITCS